MAARPNRTDDELRQISEHLFYELWMLDTTARVLAMEAFGEGPVRNALLESFTIHARGLLQFFFPSQPRPDDALAVDSLSDTPAWEGARGEMPPILADLAARVGKEVAHLTYGRLLVTAETKPWHFLDAVKALSLVAQTFRSMVPDNLLGPHWNGRSVT